MKIVFWVTAFAVLSITCAKNSTAKTKQKRQLDNIRTPHFQYSLVLPNSRVSHFRSLASTRRISNAAPRGGKLPPYAVQMEPVVQYSQKDPLYGPNHDNLEENVVNKNEIYAQPKILNVHDENDNSFGPPYGSLPTAPLYSEEVHPHYYDAPEPIIEIIIRDSNESLPAPPPAPIQKKKKEPVQVFYVKYSKDPHSKDKVVYENPIPAITPPSNDEDDHHQDYITVTPEPLYIPTQTTTLRAIIKPESEIYHTNSNVKVTFGNDEHYYGNRREESLQGEEREETAPRPAIALPNQQLSDIHSERSASPRPQYNQEVKPLNQPNSLGFQHGQTAQSRIQFQQPFINNGPQLPRQGPSVTPFRAQTPRQNNIGPSPSLSPRPSFLNVSPNPSNHFANVAPTVPVPVGPSFSTFTRPNNQPPFHSRPGSVSFGTRQHFPPRTNFHPGPQRPFHQLPQSQTYFDEAKYLQENYHTITTDHVDPPKVQLSPSRPTQNFNIGPKPNPNPTPAHFSDNQSRPQQVIPFNQQLPQQRPPQTFDINKNKPTFGIAPSRSPFFNLKPSPPHIEDNRIPFQRQPTSQTPQQHVSFHQGPQLLPRPSVQITSSENGHIQNSFSGIVSPSPSPSPNPSIHNQFLPQPSSTPFFNFQPQPSPTPTHINFQQQSFASERPHNNPSERPQTQHTDFQKVSNSEHQQNINQFVPNGGELVPSISKYEQHITVDEQNTQTNLNGFSGLNQPAPTASLEHQQYLQQRDQQQQQQHRQQQRDQQQQQQHRQQQQQNFEDEQAQVRQQLAQNVRKQQEEIQRLQVQLQYAQQQHQQQQQEQNHEQNFNQYQQQVQQSSPSPQYIQERSKQQPSYVSSTAAPQFYQSTSRTVEIKPTTQNYVTSTSNIISSTAAPKTEEKKRPAIELPDEVPDDLRQQLLSSGILDNADISILDYDKVGETPLESLPPDQLANFFSAGGGQQIASSEHRPIVVKPNGDSIESRADENIEEEDQYIAASENVPSYVAPPPDQGVEMKVVHFDPKTPEGQKIANDYVKEDATQIDPVALNDKKYNRYLPLKVSGNQFPLPEILKGRKITSVVVLAPVQTETLSGEHLRSERDTTDNLKGIKFVAGDSLHNLLKKPTKDNFEKWLDVEKKTASDEQSVILLVTGDNDPSGEKEIFMYDITSGKVNKLDGELSNAFVEAAENNSLSKDLEKLAIEGEGTPENFNKEPKDAIAEGSENVPLFVDLSGVSVDNDNNRVLISTGYSKTKRGRAIRRH